MAQAALTIAPRFSKPSVFIGTQQAWNALCDLYPSAESPDVLLAVVSYCAARKLDPLRRPCHIVPMWNSRLRRKVQVIMQGINEVETTAHRTGLWAGMDPPQWGPDVTHTFKGIDEDTKKPIQVTLTYPAHCSVTVHKEVKGKARPFTEQLFWIESYGRAAFRSELPNARWTQAPRQMLHKCVKAAVLRAAFPEEAGEYVAEEMEGRDVIDADPGPIIDGTAETGTGTDNVTNLHDPFPELDEANGTQWLLAYQRLLNEAADLETVEAIAADPRVKAALNKSPSLIRRSMGETLHKARERFSVPQDARAELIAEIEQMDSVALNDLATNAEWRRRYNALEFPPDRAAVDEAIVQRRAALRGA